MASIPLPALDIRPPAQQPSALEQFGQAMALHNQMQNAPLQTQEMQQNVQASQLENQQKQLQLQDAQTIRQLSPKFVKKDDSGNVTGYDYDGLFNGAASAGVSPQTLTALQKSISDSTLARANATKAQLDNEQTLNTQAYNHLEGLRGTQDPAQRQQLWGSALQWAQQNAGALNFNAGGLPQQAPDDNGLNAIEASLGMHAQVLADASKMALNSRNTAQAGEAQAQTTKINAETNPDSPLYAPSPAAVAMGTAPGADRIVAGEAAEAGKKAGAEANARQPYELALAKQKQALSQGDPNAAAQLMVNGDATLSELKARGATPDFIANALSAAHQLSGGQYNAQQADAQFAVAKSPTNVAFFGSARSLTDKGGTLDQLAAAAKDLPGGMFPAFNSIEDWEKAATGNGPISKYASLALGVADDYSKVMGGGQGSDSSRLQALNLVGAKLSPDQRAGSIEGIRGAVTSQTQSRIGNNPILKRMYGNGRLDGSAAPKVGDVKTFPNGKTGKWDGTGWEAQ